MDTSCTKSAQPCVIVGSQFCTPRPMDLVFTTQAPGLEDGDFMVTGMGRNVFKAERSSRSLQNGFRDEKLLFFNGSHVISMQEKKISEHSRWQAFMVDSSGRKDKLFTVKKASAFQSRTLLEVFLAKGRREKKACDFKIMGSYDNRTCAIYQGNSSIVVAQMNAEPMVANMLQEKQPFGMHINPNIDCCFVVALTVILNEMYHNKGTMIRIAKGTYAFAAATLGIIGATAEIINATNS